MSDTTNADAASSSLAAGAEASATKMDLGLFAVSTAILTLEILQTKIFAYTLDPMTIYLAIGMCLLGLGASATVLAVIPPVPALRVPGLAALFAALGALTIPAAHMLFAQIGDELISGGFSSVVGLVVLAVPYFCLGMTVALILVARSATIGRAYAVNLLGSAVGCVIVLPLLDAVGAELAVVISAAMALLAAALLSPPQVRALARIALIGGALVVFGLQAPALLPFPPDSQGQLGITKRTMAAQAKKHGKTFVLEPLMGRWDRTGRIDIYKVETEISGFQPRVGAPLEVRLFMQDASAGSVLLGVGEDVSRGREFYERTVYGAGYARDGVDDVMIIGLGGGPDILTALHYGAKKIVAVEINRTAIEIMRDDFRDFLGDAYRQPQVEIHNMDGRSYLRQSDDQFDLIQMSGVDTKTVFASGSMSMNENYLYTREAIADQLARLAPGGVLAVNRFGDFQLHRFASVALEGLRDLGVTEPERHLVAIRQGFWGTLLVKQSPYTSAELNRLHGWIGGDGEPPEIMLPSYELLGVNLNAPMEIAYSPEPKPVAKSGYFQALARGKLDVFMRYESQDHTAPVDDRPFFFFSTKVEDALSEPPVFLQALYGMAARLAGIAAVFILAPLLVLRVRGLGTPGAARSLVYFSCLGVAFMLVEIGLIQRFVLLLGHQSYSISVVMLGILVGASLGSWLSGRISVTSRAGIGGVIAGLIGLVFLYSVGLDGLFHSAASAGFGARLALALVLLMILGIPLGMPFPLGLRSLGGASLPLAAWGIGVNGFASVIGSTMATPLAMLGGLRFLLLTGAALYLVALLAAPVGRRFSASA
jgi:spermidine synthase